MTHHRRACVLCGQPTGRDDALELALHLDGGAVVVVRWHMTPHPSGAGSCASLDPMHDPLADALSMPDGQAGDLAAIAAYNAIRDRAADRGPDHLRAAVEVRRDYPTGRWTLRGDGLRWGLLSRRR